MHKPRDFLVAFSVGKYLSINASPILHNYSRCTASKIMRTTLDIPAELLDEIMELTGAATKNQAVREVLEEQIKLMKRKRLLTMKGTIDLDLDLDNLRDRDS